MTVLATAGHVDHGKSTFVNFLTGQETDRLKEEKILKALLRVYSLGLLLFLREVLMLLKIFHF